MFAYLGERQASIVEAYGFDYDLLGINHSHKTIWLNKSSFTAFTQISLLLSKLCLSPALFMVSLLPQYGQVNPILSSLI